MVSGRGKSRGDCNDKYYGFWVEFNRCMRDVGEGGGGVLRICGAADYQVRSGE